LRSVSSTSRMCEVQREYHVSGSLTSVFSLLALKFRVLREAPCAKPKMLDIIDGRPALQLFGTGKGRMSHTGGHNLADGGEEGWPLGVQLFGGREQLMCVQQFLIKGLLKAETELCTIEVPLQRRQEFLQLKT
jgi:hypothetical protein